MKLSKTKQTLYGNLQNVKMRRRHGLFTVEGPKAVSDMSRHFSMEALVAVTGTDIPPLLRDVSPAIYETDDKGMKEMSGFTTPSRIMGVFHIPESECQRIDSDKLYLLLDGVRDPGNMGTIIRTCHWFGIFDIYASSDSVDCYNPKAVQATMGSLGAVKVHYCDLPGLVDAHGEMPVYGTLLDGDDIFETEMHGGGFIVMGNEGSGLSAEMRRRVTKALQIPPATENHGESLNVAVATAIVLAQFIR